MQRTNLLKRVIVQGTQIQQRALSATSYKYILTETKGNVGVITLNRPKQLNALCNDLIEEVLVAGRAFDKDANVGCIVITGSEKAFAAGADIKEMSSMTYAECYTNNLFANWADLPKISKPVLVFLTNQR
jgi:enoyl-CoA hydratase/carnithine racemase